MPPELDDDDDVDRKIPYSQIRALALESQLHPRYSEQTSEQDLRSEDAAVEEEGLSPEEVQELQAELESVEEELSKPHMQKARLTSANYARLDNERHYVYGRQQRGEITDEQTRFLIDGLKDDMAKELRNGGGSKLMYDYRALERKREELANVLNSSS